MDERLYMYVIRELEDDHVKGYLCGTHINGPRRDWGSAVLTPMFVRQEEATLFAQIVGLKKGGYVIIGEYFDIDDLRKCPNHRVKEDETQQ